MPTGLPCPNPSCTHVFAPDAVKGAAALKCPRCGHVFKFRSTSRPSTAPTQPPAARPAQAKPAARTTPAAAPTARPAPPAPMPAPPPPPPLATPVAAEPPAPPEGLAPPSDFEPPSLERYAGRRRRRSGGWVAPVVTIVVVLLLFGGGGYAAYRTGLLDAWLTAVTSGADGVTSGPAHTSTNFNYRFAFPATGRWRVDDRVRIDTKARLGLRRTDPNSWMALMIQDYKERTPPEAEVLDEGVQRLNAVFQHVEWEPRPETTLAGRKAQRIVFQAQAGEMNVTGDCTMLAQHGLAYWLVTWAPETNVEAVVDEWDRLRAGFSLLKERDGWAERPPRTVPIQGKKATYSLAYVEKLWEEQNAADYDTAGDIALLGRDQSERQHADKTATAVVLVLPKADDLKAATDAALKYIEMRQKELYEGTTLQEATDQKAKQGQDRPPDEIGNSRGRVLRLEVNNSETRKRLFYVAVVPRGDQTVVVQCECDWKRRTYWEVNFAQLLKTFKPGK